MNFQRQEIKVFRLDNRVLGEHLIKWDSGANKGLMVYILEISRDNHRYLVDVKKMIVN